MLMWRVITAVILIPLVIGGLFFTSSETFRWIAAAVFLLIAFEWGNLCQFKQKWHFFIFLVGFAAILFFLPLERSILWLGALFWLVPLYCCIKNPEILKTPIARALMGWVALTCAYQGFIFLRAMNMGLWWILWLFLLIWSSDIFAYFTGKAWGKRRLAPTISPNKTQEGLLGGLIGAMFVAAIAYYYLNTSYGWFLIAFITVLLGVLGDLFESLLKRLANVKDSGRLLPGHGGVFDRLDSLIAALPFYALSLSYIT